MTHYVLPKRYVTSPTTLQEYESEKDGFDSDVDSKPDLYKEYEENTGTDSKDTVEGSESFYTPFYKLAGVNPSFNDVNGSEGFTDTLKEWGDTITRKIKAFFKWLWDFFFNKTRIIEKRSHLTGIKMKASDVKKGDLVYPSTTWRLYTLPSGAKPESNLNWVSKNLTSVSDTIKGLNSFLEGISKIKWEDSTEGANAFHKLVFGSFTFKNDVCSYFGNNEIIYLKGKTYLKTNNRSGAFTSTPRPTFKTDKTTVWDDVKKQAKIIEEWKNTQKKIAQKEGVFIEAVKKAEPKDKSSVSIFTNNTMNFIKTIEGQISRGLSAFQDVVDASMDFRIDIGR